MLELVEDFVPQHVNTQCHHKYDTLVIFLQPMVPVEFLTTDQESKLLSFDQEYAIRAHDFEKRRRERPYVPPRMLTSRDYVASEHFAPHEVFDEFHERVANYATDHAFGDGKGTVSFPAPGHPVAMNSIQRKDWNRGISTARHHDSLLYPRRKYIGSDQCAYEAYTCHVTCEHQQHACNVSVHDKAKCIAVSARGRV